MLYKNVEIINIYKWNNHIIYIYSKSVFISFFVGLFKAKKYTLLPLVTNEDNKGKKIWVKFGCFCIDIIY